MTKDTPALVRSDLRAWAKTHRDPAVVSLSELAHTGIRGLEYNPENHELRASLWKTIISLGAAVGRPIGPAECMPKT